MILLFVFGFTFYRLAKQFNKNPWGWGFLGAAMFVAFQFIVGICFGILYEFAIINELEDRTLSILAAILSAIITYFIYAFLKKKWNKEDTSYNLNIEDIGKKENENQFTDNHSDSFKK